MCQVWVELVVRMRSVLSVGGVSSENEMCAKCGWSE